MQICFTVNRQGIGSHVGSIILSAMLSKNVGGPVTMEGPKTFGSSKFIGDPGSCAKLNGSKELLKTTEKLARTKSDVGGGIRMDRYVKIEPYGTGSTFIIITLPRATSMGISATTDAKDFFTIASLMEGLL